MEPYSVFLVDFCKFRSMLSRMNNELELAVSERNAALRDAWGAHRKIEALTTRLHEVIAARNELLAKNR